jgi:hypothetical protein
VQNPGSNLIFIRTDEFALQESDIVYTSNMEPISVTSKLKEWWLVIEGVESVKIAV